MDNSKGTLIGVVAVAIGLIALGVAWFHNPVTVVTTENAGGERAGIQEGIDGYKAGDLNSKWKSAKMEVATSSVKVYCNTTGNDVVADYGEAIIPTGSTASSTSNVSLIATTSTSIPTWVDFGTLTEGKRALLQGIVIATSTTATTTNSVLASAQGKSAGATLIPTGSCIFGVLQQNTTLCGTQGNASGAACESATSTNRGFNPIFNVRVRAAKVQTQSL